jgi:hypothetical protein
MNTSQVVGTMSPPARPPRPPPAAAAAARRPRRPTRFFISAITRSGVIFFRKPSFCDAITSPEIFSLPVENSFIGSAWPVAMAMKSASLSSSVHFGAVPAPAVTEPGGVPRSIVHTLSGRSA